MAIEWLTIVLTCVTQNDLHNTKGPTDSYVREAGTSQAVDKEGPHEAYYQLPQKTGSVRCNQRPNLVVPCEKS